jgi:hypothetical protein
MSQRYCRYRHCTQPLIDGEHRNRQYCDDDCKREEQLLRQNENYAQYKWINNYRRNHQTLKELFTKYGSRDLTLPYVLMNGFNPALNEGQMLIQGKTLNKIGDLFYIIQNNKINIYDESIHASGLP